jgi:hypothetical protein
VSAVTDAQATALLAPVHRFYTAYTLTQRTEAGQLAAMALDLVRDSGMTAAEICEAARRWKALAGWPTDLRECHPPRNPNYVWDEQASFAVDAPNRVPPEVT